MFFEKMFCKMSFYWFIIGRREVFSLFPFIFFYIYLFFAFFPCKLILFGLSFLLAFLFLGDVFLLGVDIVVTFFLI